MNFDSLEDYIHDHIDAEPDLLKQINREAHVKILHGDMLSGHLQGRMLKMFTQMIQPRKILEIGTFVGYSTLCFAEALSEDAEIHTIEINDELEDIIRANFAKSQYNDQIKLYIGDAAGIIPQFDSLSFDLVFIDADKKKYREYYEMILPTVRPGGFIIVDNTLWYGKVVADVKSNDWSTQAILDFNEVIAHDTRVEKVILPVRDGITIIRKKQNENGK